MYSPSVFQDKTCPAEHTEGHIIYKVKTLRTIVTENIHCKIIK